MPASAAQVFGPVTITRSFSATGEQTLLVMNTTLPSGGRNVIIVSHMISFVSITSYAWGYFLIKKGATVLYQTPLTNLVLEHWKPKMHIAVDNAPTGNDVYTYAVVVSTAASISVVFHLQAVVIKADDAAIAYNTATVSVTAGATSTVISLNTSYPTGSKVVVIGFLSGSWTNSSGTHVAIGVGTARLKYGTTILSSNEFTVGSNYYFGIHPLSVNLLALTTATGPAQTWAVEFSNTTTYNHDYLYAAIVTFTVFDGAFIDTSSVALSNGVRVTVGNLLTALTGDVVALAIASPDNTNASDVIAFNVGDVVFQKDNSSTDEISNRVSWTLQASTSTLNALKTGNLLMARLDTGVTNPSYQIKMTARTSGINGEAKILAFVLFTGLDIKRSIFESMSTSEGFIFGRRRFNYLTESLSIGEFKAVFRDIKRLVGESVNLVEQLVMSRVWVKIFTENERISEVGRVLRGLMRLVVEEIRAFESAIRFRNRFRSLAESLRISEVISISRHLAKAVGESVRVLEHAFKSLVISRVISELARISEVFASAKGKSLSVSEGLNLSEAVGRITGLVRDIIEQIGVSEASVKVRSFVKILGERLDLSEFIKAGRVAVRHISESVRIPEVVVHFKGAVRVLGENLRIVEISNVSRSLMRQVGEAIRIEEAITRLRSMFRAMAEGLAILEDKLMTRYVVKVVDAVMRVGEYVVGFGGKAISILEHIRILEFRRVRKIRTYVRRIVSSLRGKSRAR